MHDRRRWLWPIAGLVVLGLVVAAAVALTGDGDDKTEVVQDDPTASSTTSAPTTTTTTAPTTTDTPAATSTTGSAPPTASGPVPGAVTVIRGAPAGGSGEIMVEWEAVAGATGYRVLRSDTAGGPYALAADYDVATGHATRAEDVVYVGAPTVSYFQYVEYGESRVRWFQVVAYNAAGDAPPSAAVSGSSP